MLVPGKNYCLALLPARASEAFTSVVLGCKAPNLPQNKHNALQRFIMVIVK